MRESSRQRRRPAKGDQKENKSPNKRVYELAKQPTKHTQPVSYTHLTLPTICSV